MLEVLSDEGVKTGENESSRPSGRVDHVVRAVSDHIRDHALQPGDALPSEMSFTRQLGVSRAVVREAFRSLSALRLIDVENGRRARVAKLDHGAMAMVIGQGMRTDQINVHQIYDVRRTIELRTVALAALHRSDLEAAEITMLATSLRSNFRDEEKVMAADIALHELIAKASRNPVFDMIVRAFREVTIQTWPIGWRSRDTDANRMENVACHEAIATAIDAGDPQAAAAAMAEHFDDSAKALIAAGIS